MKSAAIVETLNRELGRTLRDERIRRGISIASLAGKIGCSERLLQSYERGLTQIPAGTAFMMAIVLGCDAVDLITRAAGEEVLPEQRHAAQLYQTYQRVSRFAQQDRLQDIENVLVTLEPPAA